MKRFIQLMGQWKRHYSSQYESNLQALTFWNCSKEDSQQWTFTNCGITNECIKLTFGALIGPASFKRRALNGFNKDIRRDVSVTKISLYISADRRFRTYLVSDTDVGKTEHNTGQFNFVIIFHIEVCWLCSVANVSKLRGR